MLVKFTVSNFRSIKEEAVLDLQAKPISEFKAEGTFQTSFKDVSILKGAVIYGPNSSGKSNLLNAITFMKWFVLNSSKELQANEAIDVECFLLSTETIDKPSCFEIEFIISDRHYRYGFQVDGRVVHKEWLYYRKKIKEFKVFERLGQNIEVLNADFNNGGDEIIKLTRENALFLSLVAQFNGSMAISLVKQFKDIAFVSGTNDSANFRRTTMLLADPRYKTNILKFISSANLGFEEIKTETFDITEEILKGVPKEIQKIILKQEKKETMVRTRHVIYNKDNEPEGTTFFEMVQGESLGTRKFFSMAGPIVTALMDGTALVIDEFDSTLHPSLSKGMILLFNSEHNNPHNAQLIFTTHNATLLSQKIFRRDQIIMTKKNDFGATKVESLFDLKVRKDASYEKDYLLGKYEGIPKLEFSNQLDLFKDFEGNI